jgi:endonuclease-8
VTIERSATVASMPEGHTIHRLAADHRAALGGRPVRVSSPQGRFADGAALVDGTVLEGVDAHGKHLFYEFGGDRLVHVHLGLFGKVWPLPVPPPSTHRAVRMRLVGETTAFDLTGPTACDVLDPAGRDAIVARLGPDPLRRDADPERAWAAIRRRRSPIGQALMDQSVLSGIGNVYRAEVLFLHGVHPLVPCTAVDRETWDAMWRWLVAALKRGVKEQRILTVDAKEIGKPKSRITRAEATYVYKQEHCRRCGTAVRRWELAGRWAYACESCQPLAGPVGGART